jgi:hypothetical protein
VSFDHQECWRPLGDRLFRSPRYSASTGVSAFDGTHWLEGAPPGMPAGAGLMPEGSRLPSFLTILSNSGQERRCLFGQYAKAL